MIRTLPSAKWGRVFLLSACLCVSLVFLVLREELNPALSLLSLALVGSVGAVGIQLWTDRAFPSKVRLLGPLGLFSLVFVLVLAVRAVPLALGMDGRYFVVDDGKAVPLIAERLANDQPEAGPGVPRRAEFSAPQAKVDEHEVKTIGHVAYRGSKAIELRVLTQTKLSYIALALPTPRGGSVPVSDGAAVSASVAWMPLAPLPSGTKVDLAVRYSATDLSWVGEHVVSQAAAAAVSRWSVLQGSDTVPPGAALATPLFLVRPVRAGAVHLALDAPLVIPGAKSTRPFLNDEGDAEVGDSFGIAAALAVAMLAAVLAGFLLGIGEAAASLVPRLTLAHPREGPTRRLIIAITVLGIAAYLTEMTLHGGYFDYVGSLSDPAEATEGKWYLRATALIPSGIAAMLLARRLLHGHRERWGSLDWFVVVVGTLIPLSYLLKAPLAIPLLTILLVWYVVSRRALVWLAATGIVGALLLPLVYLIRFEGFSASSQLFSGGYWREFGTNVTSRFFHFESFMITVPLPSSEAPWRPFVDFFATAVPRVFWEGKPVSPATRFTQEHLLNGLNTGTDVGVISLPGEFWLIGGSAGLLAGGLTIGVLLSLANGLIRRADGDGMLLLAAGLTTCLVFWNDGWGIASATIEALIGSLGWLIFLRRAQPTAPP
jgi:hypothetical protein